MNPVLPEKDIDILNFQPSGQSVYAFTSSQDIVIGILIAHANTVKNADVDTPHMMMKMTTDPYGRNPLPKSLFNKDMKMETLKLISLGNHQESLTIMFFIPKEHLSQNNQFQS